MDTKKITDVILAAVQAVKRCWTEGWHEEKFRQCIHPSAVAIVPSEPGLPEGKEACVAVWRGFAQAAVIRECRETGHRVQVYAGGKSAVFTYLFSITFVKGTQEKTMRGRACSFP